jgi:hypothetical protein
MEPETSSRSVMSRGVVSLFAGIQRKDSRAEQAVAHPLDERGIALRANDLFVDATGIRGVHRFARHELAVDRKQQILKCGVGGERKEIVCLADARAEVYKSLIDFVVQYMIDQLDVYVAARAPDVGAAVEGWECWAIGYRENSGSTRARNDPALRGERGGRERQSDERAEARAGKEAHDVSGRGADGRRWGGNFLHTSVSS